MPRLTSMTPIVIRPRYEVSFGLAGGGGRTGGVGVGVGGGPPASPGPDGATG